MKRKENFVFTGFYFCYLQIEIHHQKYEGITRKIGLLINLFVENIFAKDLKTDFVYDE